MVTAVKFYRNQLEFLFSHVFEFEGVMTIDSYAQPPTASHQPCAIRLDLEYLQSQSAHTLSPVHCTEA